MNKYAGILSIKDDWNDPSIVFVEAKDKDEARHKAEVEFGFTPGFYTHERGDTALTISNAI